MAERPWQDEEALREEFITKNRKQAELAEEWQCSETTIQRWLGRFGIRKREGYTLQGDHPWRDEETMRRLYLTEGKSTYEIAEELGTGRNTVKRWLDHHDIPRRSESESRILSGLTDPVPYTTGLDGYEYWRHQHRGIRDYVYAHRLLAVAEFGFAAVRGKHVHHKNGVEWDNRPGNIQLMSHKKHIRHHVSKLKPEEYEEIRALYENGEVETYAELGRMYGIHPTNVYRAISGERNTD